MSEGIMFLALWAVAYLLLDGRPGSGGGDGSRD